MYDPKNVPGSFANIASKGYNTSSSFAAAASSNHRSTSSGSSNNNSISRATTAAVPTMRIPLEVWNPHDNRDAASFFLSDPMDRFQAVMATHKGLVNVIDLHFQSTKTFGTVLETVLHEATSVEGVWIVTGTGHHVGNKTHQKGGGALEAAVLQWLLENGYNNVCRGRDANGQGGALFVPKRYE
jgi:hypothetical protein